MTLPIRKTYKYEHFTKNIYKDIVFWWGKCSWFIQKMNVIFVVVAKIVTTQCIMVYLVRFNAHYFWGFFLVRISGKFLGNCIFWQPHKTANTLYSAISSEGKYWGNVFLVIHCWWCHQICRRSRIRRHSRSETLDVPTSQSAVVEFLSWLCLIDAGCKTGPAL